MHLQSASPWLVYLQASRSNNSTLPPSCEVSFIPCFPAMDPELHVDRHCLHEFIDGIVSFPVALKMSNSVIFNIATKLHHYHHNQF